MLHSLAVSYTNGGVLKAYIKPQHLGMPAAYFLAGIQKR